FDDLHPERDIPTFIDAQRSDHVESAMRPDNLSESFVDGVNHEAQCPVKILDWTYSGSITDVLSVEPREME
ncbi:MAG TPA: hypothetical protein VFO86_00905, partial [Terriglobia bacterium]|nr:hypothetical protein [Terriglobia bacterium]